MGNCQNNKLNYKLNINASAKNGYVLECNFNLIKSDYDGIMVLDKKKSLNYYNDNDVRNNINKKNKKILVLLNVRDGVLDMSALSLVHTLFLISPKNIININMISHIHTLYLTFCKDIIDINELSNIKKLRLSDCPNIKNINGLTNVIDLKIGCGNCKDIGSLRQIKKLTIYQKVYGIQFLINLEEFTVSTDNPEYCKKILKKIMAS